MSRVASVEHLESTVSGGISSQMGDNEDGMSSSNIHVSQVIKPVIVSLKLAGCYFPSRCKSDNVSGNPPTSVNPWRIFCTISMVIHWVNAVRFIIVFKDKNDDMSYLLLKAVIFSWFLSNASNVSVFYYACASPRCLAALKEDLHMTSSFWTPGYVRYVRRRAWLYCIASWIMAACNFAFLVYVLFKNSIFEMMVVPFTKTMAGFDIARFCYIVVMLLMTTAWIFPITFFYMICSLLSGQFLLINKMLEQSVTDAGNIKGSLEFHRRRHNQICNLVDHADRFLKYYIGIGMTQNMVGACVILYILLYYSSVTVDVFTTVSLIFWFLGMLLNLGIVSMGAAYVNHVAHASADTVYMMSAESVSTDQSLQITMFLKRLTGPSIGFSALNMFVLDKATILTIVGMLLTYFIILVQFKPSSDIPNMYSNFTTM